MKDNEIKEGGKLLTGLLVLIVVLVLAIILILLTGQSDKKSHVSQHPKAKEYVVVDKALSEQMSSRVAAALLLSEKGDILPVSQSGKPLKRCQKSGRNACHLYKEGAKVDVESVKTVSIVQYKVNPLCFYFHIGGYLYEQCYELVDGQYVPI